MLSPRRAEIRCDAGARDGDPRLSERVESCFAFKFPHLAGTQPERNVKPFKPAARIKKILQKNLLCYRYSTKIKLTRSSDSRVKSFKSRSCTPAGQPKHTIEYSTNFRATTLGFVDHGPRSLHALAQLHQGLVEGVDSDKPQTRIFDIENDINRNRHDERKTNHM